MAYKKETDYMALMNKAALSGDLEKAAELEKERNEKIDGEGLSYHKTYVYHTAPEGSTALKPTAASKAKTPKSTYDKSYAKKKDKALNEVLSVEDFSYDAKSDPLFSQYEKAYTRAAKLTGEDVLGKASELNGGLSSSYAVTAAAQAQNAQMDKLTDVIPELYEMAYDRYLKDIDTKIKQYQLLEEADSTAYNRYLKDREREDSLKEKDRAYALEAGKAAWDQMYAEAELTGVYKNQPTRKAQQFDRELTAKEKETLADAAWYAISGGIYDDSFAEILGLDAGVLKLLAASAQTEQEKDSNEDLMEVAWTAIENGVYEDWFSDVLSLTPENLKAMAAYNAQKMLSGNKSTSSGSSGGGKTGSIDKATYGDIMVAMVNSDDPYSVFMSYAPQLGRVDYEALYDAMRGIEYSKNQKKKTEEGSLIQKTFFPVQFIEQQSDAPPEEIEPVSSKTTETSNTDEKKKEKPFFPFVYTPLDRRL
ncbi:MAG: hypothetical protein II359_00430 [Clostridia bacterium]|nr:hypothetical protein [Clostridia bacterium]